MKHHNLNRKEERRLSQSAHISRRAINQENRSGTPVASGIVRWRESPAAEEVTLWRRLRKGPCGDAGVAVVCRVLSRRRLPPSTCDLDVARCEGRQYVVHKLLPWPRHT